MTVTQIVPRQEQVDLDALLQRLSDPQTRAVPFSDAILDFCARFSTALFRDPEARGYPELQALAFWMRKSELTRIKAEFESLQSETTLLMPRGLVFHVPPSNVDTIFIYSWILSVISGNTNIIRVSDRAAEASAVICRIFNAAIAESDPSVGQNTAMLRYGREREITASISAVADVRVIWGGDATVNTIRSIPLPPHGQELTFPDRYALAVLNADAYLKLEPADRQALAGKFYNDTFWFDQMACSSPRVVIWVGRQESCERASTVFYDELESEVSRKQYALATGPRLNKLTFAYRAILDQPVTRFRQAGPECAVLTLEEVSNLDREHCGGGLLFQAYAQELNEIAPLIIRRDQTLTHFGFTRDELRNLARLLNGRGIDRIVPVGHALNFNRFWDGYDLLREFTRTVYIQS